MIENKELIADLRCALVRMVSMPIRGILNKREKKKIRMKKREGGETGNKCRQGSDPREV